MRCGHQSLSRHLFMACCISGSSMPLSQGPRPKFQEMANTIPKIKPGDGRIYFFRAAGPYLAATTTDLRKTLAIPLAEGETKYVRMSPSFGLVVGSIVLDLEPAEKARAEMGWLACAGQAIVNK
jgi:hypothetical protein